MCFKSAEGQLCHRDRSLVLIIGSAQLLGEILGDCYSFSFSTDCSVYSSVFCALIWLTEMPGEQSSGPFVNSEERLTQNKFALVLTYVQKKLTT